MKFTKVVEAYVAVLVARDKQEYWARLRLDCEEEHTLWLNFRPPSTDLTPPGYREADKVGYCYRYYDEYQNYLDMVRNEKPIRVTFYPEDEPPHFVVHTSLEPPGEEEG